MARHQEYATAAPLGYMGLGMATVLLGLHNAQLVPPGAAVVAMGLVCGGVMQFCAGMLEYGTGNTFGLTAFVALGAFWLSFVVLACLPQWGLASDPAPVLLGRYMWVWAVFAAILAAGSLVASRVHQIVFFSLAVQFVLLGCAGVFARPVLMVVGGYAGLLCGIGAIYLAAAAVLEAQFDRPVLPTGLPSAPAPRAGHDELLVQLS
ncbi:hypothetical protein DY926_13375 [Komagataeibacter melaceti]|uniref:Uncharacterized protein n=1 Tax=Komagataeibacter melaceti TaxID=2766577 RepID=A0A371YXX0_9PROT|nr:GPR1/FUN34/YaaH family transporter [Komagataeibacter melaceti]RFD19043.1 hypothetical protein DY926_13375 [Komagataeibacter melaceti]